MIRRRLPALLLFAVFLSATAFRFIQPDKAAFAVLTAEKMNVLYCDLDNPVAVVAGGIDPKDIEVTATGAAITGENGHYMVHPEQTGRVILTASYMKEGSSQVLSSSTFRVKQVPNPVCYVGDIKDIGEMQKEKLAVERGIFARMVNFDFDMRFQVASFDLTTRADTGYVTQHGTGPVFNTEMLYTLRQVKSGDRVFVENVMVTMPAGAPRKIPGVTIIVK